VEASAAAVADIHAAEGFPGAGLGLDAGREILEGPRPAPDPADAAVSGGGGYGCGP
jgi:hypothetical protein